MPDTGDHRPLMASGRLIILKCKTNARTTVAVEGRSSHVTDHHKRLEAWVKAESTAGNAKSRATGGGLGVRGIARDEPIRRMGNPSVNDAGGTVLPSGLTENMCAWPEPGLRKNE
jgi:hypothetical protein